MNLPQLNQQSIYQQNNSNLENVNMFHSYHNHDGKNLEKDNTRAYQMIDQIQKLECQWRSNILIQSTQNRQIIPFALRRLTSFQERSMDTHGKRLAQTFREYVCWLTKVNYIGQTFGMHKSLSQMEWATVQYEIRELQNLREQQKNILISAAYKSTQAQLIISEIIEQIPEQYYVAALSVAAELIKQFMESKICGKNEEQTQDYVSQSYIITAQNIYGRLCELGMGNIQIRDHQCYLNFVKAWMQVFYLSLNGFLDNPYDRRKKSSTDVYKFSENTFQKKDSFFE